MHPDKSNDIVILNGSDYIKSMAKLLVIRKNLKNLLMTLQ